MGNKKGRPPATWIGEVIKGKRSNETLTREALAIAANVKKPTVSRSLAAIGVQPMVTLNSASKRWETCYKIGDIREALAIAVATYKATREG